MLGVWAECGWRRGLAVVSGIVLGNGMTAAEFIKRWSRVTQSEKAVSQSHFNELCQLLGERTPVETDPEGDEYCFERGAAKDSGGDGWADVWKRGCFAWEYKTQGKDLDAAFQQLRQYALALENPPLLIVSDMRRFRIHTNWTNSVSTVHEFTIYDLEDTDVRNKLKWAFSEPERLRPEQTRQALTEQAAATFAEVAQGLRNGGHEPADSGALRQPAGVLHVRRRRGAAAGPDVPADAGPGAAAARTVCRDGRQPVRGHEGRRRGRV